MTSAADDYMRALDAVIDALRAGDSAALAGAEAAADQARDDMREAHEQSTFVRGME